MSFMTTLKDLKSTPSSHLSFDLSRDLVRSMADLEKCRSSVPCSDLCSDVFSESETQSQHVPLLWALVVTIRDSGPSPPNEPQAPGPHRQTNLSVTVKRVSASFRQRPAGPATVQKSGLYTAAATETISRFSQNVGFYIIWQAFGMIGVIKQACVR